MPKCGAPKFGSLQKMVHAFFNCPLRRRIEPEIIVDLMDAKPFLKYFTQHVDPTRYKPDYHALRIRQADHTCAAGRSAPRRKLGRLRNVGDNVLYHSQFWPASRKKASPLHVAPVCPLSERIACLQYLRTPIRHPCFPVQIQTSNFLIPISVNSKRQYCCLRGTHASSRQGDCPCSFRSSWAGRGAVG
jgi:hypothetical protein